MKLAVASRFYLESRAEELMMPKVRPIFSTVHVKVRTSPCFASAMKSASKKLDTYFLFYLSDEAQVADSISSMQSRAFLLMCPSLSASFSVTGSVTTVIFKTMSYLGLAGS